MAITVLVADDQPIVRSGIRHELFHHSDIEVVGDAANADEVLRLVRELRPNVLVLDINMPGVKALQILRDLVEAEISPQVLIFTAHGDPENVLGVLKAGARGYIVKDADPSEIANGIRAVAGGKSWFSPELLNILLESVVSVKSKDGKNSLSVREKEVLCLIGKGHNNQQIAERLSISQSTVKNHLTNIYEKLELHTRAEAVAWAWRHGLVKV